MFLWWQQAVFPGHSSWLTSNLSSVSFQLQKKKDDILSVLQEVWVLCLISFKRIVCLWENKLPVGQILILTIVTFGKGSWPNDPDFRVCAATYSGCLLLNEVGVQHSSVHPIIQVAAFPTPGLSACWLTSNVKKSKKSANTTCVTACHLSASMSLTATILPSLTRSASTFIQMKWLQNLISFNQICPTWACKGCTVQWQKVQVDVTTGEANKKTRSERE